MFSVPILFTKENVCNLRCKQFVFCVFLAVQGTLDVGLIDSVCASDNPDR